MERETGIFPSKAIWTHSMAAGTTSPTQRLGAGRPTGGATRGLMAVKPGAVGVPISNQGPPLWLDHCVCMYECESVLLRPSP